MTDTHEQLLEDAFKKVQAALKKKPTTENIKNAEAARKALEAYRAELATEADPAARRFDNLLEVLGYLTDEGWKIAKSKLYADQGKIKKEKNGAYTRKAVDEYARLCLTRLDGSDQDEPGMEAKARIETDIAKEKFEKIKRENEIEGGKWVLRSEVEQKHTAKLGLLMTAIDNFIHGGKLEGAVEIVGGSREKATEFKEFFKKEFRGMLGEYAKRPEFTIPKQAMAEAEELIMEVEG